MRIAVVGAGISGLTVAYLLRNLHDLTVYEAADYPGGHSNTVDVEVRSRSLAVDTGFIVFNDRTYPNFERLLAELGVRWQWSDMSFSVQCARTGLEYNGGSLWGLFAQKRNLVNPKFWGMLREIARFRKELRRLADEGDDCTTLGEFLKAGRFGASFTKKFLAPMTAAIWSAKPNGLLDEFPARFFAKFFANHGFLDADRPRWKTIVGGSRNYVAPLTAPYRERIRLRTPVRSVARLPDGCEVRSADGVERYDAVVLGVHSDQALRLLENPTPLEREILGAIAYRENEAVLHTDVRQLPTRRRAWASWNYYIPASPSERPTVTYYMNLLQSLDAPEPICVTLNRTAEIDPSKILKKLTYHHPVYTRSAVHAQQRRNEINGINRTYYCGAYWGNGFHEDGVNSGIAVAESLGARRFGDA